MPKVERIVRRELKSLRAQKEKIDKRIQILERAYAELRGAEALTVAPEAPSFSHNSSRPMGANRTIIVSILESNEGPMAIRDIANKAFQSGQIRSVNGYKGVYNIVQTVLRRNKKTTFVKVGAGKWDLRVRRMRAPEKLAGVGTGNKRARPYPTEA
jgi:hypothetical protein